MRVVLAKEGTNDGEHPFMKPRALIIPWWIPIVRRVQHAWYVYNSFSLNNPGMLKLPIRPPIASVRIGFAILAGEIARVHATQRLR